MRWTLRYGVAMLVAVSLLGAYLYERIEGALRQDARLILELEMAELLKELAQFSGESPEDLARMIEPEITTADPDLDISFQIFDPEGRIRFGQGILHDRSVAVSREVFASPGTSFFREIDLGGGYPDWVLASSAGEDGSVQVGIYARIFVSSARRIRTRFLATIPIAVVVAAALGFVLARGSLRPVSDIVAAARRVKGDDPEESIPVTGSGDEFDQIAESFNQVLARIRSSMETLRRFSIDAAHQLRSPLTALRSRIEVTLETESLPPEVRGELHEVLRDVVSLAETVDAMMRLSRSEAGLDPAQRLPVELEPLLRSVIEFFEPMAKEQGLSLRLHAKGHPQVAGDPSWLRQLFVNIVENAIRYASPEGHIDVDLSLLESVAVARIRDTGRGIPTEEIDRIFDLFHRAEVDPAVPGMGLGLTLARKIAKAHGGTIDAESAPGQGSIFTVRLPVVSASGRGLRSNR